MVGSMLRLGRIWYVPLPDLTDMLYANGYIVVDIR